MKRLTLAATIAVVAAFCLPVPAQADFGLKDLDVTFTNQDGSPDTQAGSHPFAMSTTLAFNTAPNPTYGYDVPDGDLKDLSVAQIAGLVGDPTATQRCTSTEFFASNCPVGSQVGVTDVTLDPTHLVEKELAVYNLVAPPGIAAKLGFTVLAVRVTIEVGVNPNPPYNVVASLTNVPEVVPLYSSKLTLWGNPADPAHDAQRKGCSAGCPADLVKVPFLTLPRACEGPLATVFKADSWQSPGVFDEPAGVLTHDGATPPNPFGFTGCAKLGFSPSITAQPTTKAASSPTGLDFSLDVSDEGLTNPTGLAHSDIKRAVVTLPEGFSTNPSIAEGLTVCGEADLARESASSAPGAGCPNASKIGTIEVETPLLDENVNGSLYIAKPYENPFGSLLALYMVIKNKNLGIVVKQALKVEPDPVTGRLTTIADNLPQLPFSHFRLHFREGARSPLASPPGCDADPSTPERDPYNATAVLTPWSGGPPITTSSAFQIVSGPDNSPCPTAGTPPFHPGLIAGTLNNAAGRYSPFNVRLFRSDAEQEITRFSIKLPPGITGKLAGIPYCPDAAIAAAKARTGPSGGAEEEQSPSCPKASEVGHTLAGAGVGPSLAYAPGRLYLAGPYHGSALSLVSITAAKVGPFDLGTVVVRLGFKINPETAEVFLDSTGSDPIPHIIAGIPVHLRDIRAYTDRPEFVLNPTGCQRTSTASTVLGSGLSFASEADDQPLTVSTPFQAADCAALGFDPKLKLSLIGGTKRGAHPKLRAFLRMKGSGESNIAYAQVTLPHSEFLDTAHIKTICTRVQYREEKCPAGSVYGFAKAVTPILDQPLQGPVYLRSSEHNLPDLVAQLKNGQITIDLVGRVDSVGGGIRNTFEVVPDAPVSTFTLELQGAGKGLLVNSTNLCKGTHRAIADFKSHSGKRKELKPALAAKCAKAKKPHKAKGKRATSKRH
jgi:hypothetical protein